MLRKFLTLTTLAIVVLAASVSYADDLQEISNSITSSPDLISKGKTVFSANCVSCHGPEGKGDGAAAAAFNPKPRNFTAEKFKQGSSPAAAFYTVTQGLGSMPAFAAMPISDRLAVVHYILSLSPHREKDSPEALAKIGLDPSGKPLANFKTETVRELPVEFIIERMATNGNANSLNYAALEKSLKEMNVAPVVKAPAAPNLANGEVLFNSCRPCHGENGEGTELAQAPQIAGQDVDYLISTLKKFQSGMRGAHAEDVNGLKMRPMSRMLRSDEEVSDVAHYISGLSSKKPKTTFLGGDAAKGQVAFATCIACHGPDAKGMKAMQAPSIVNLQDWYIATQINNFKQGYRGAHPQDTMGATMRGMAMSIVNDQMLQDITAYLATLQ